MNKYDKIHFWVQASVFEAVIPVDRRGSPQNGDGGTLGQGRQFLFRTFIDRCAVGAGKGVLRLSFIFFRKVRKSQKYALQ